jgi:hypothetical protein
MRTYATELVSRYKDDPNVLLWELGNEYFLSADLNAAMNPSASGAGARHLGTRPRRTTDDSLTTDMLKTFYTHMAKHIKTLAPNHLVTSGDAGPRNCSRSLRESFPANVFKEDNLPDHIESLRQSQPAPLDVISIHYYGNLTGSFPEGTPFAKVGGISTRSLDLLAYLARAVMEDHKPLLVGELGQHDPRLKDDPEARFACKAIDLLEKEGAALIALWAWHFPYHPQENVTGESYPVLLQRVRTFNQRHAPLS